MQVDQQSPKVSAKTNIYKQTTSSTQTPTGLEHVGDVEEEM